MLIIRIGNLIEVGFEYIILLYQPATFETADVISTFIYRAGLQNNQYDLGAAAGLFNAVVALVLVYGANRDQPARLVVRRCGERPMTAFNLYSRGDRIFGDRERLCSACSFVLSTLYPFIYILVGVDQLRRSPSRPARSSCGRWSSRSPPTSTCSPIRCSGSPTATPSIYAVFGTLASLAIIVPGAYALSRPRLRGRRFFGPPDRLHPVVPRRHDPVLPEHAGSRPARQPASASSSAFACNAFNVILLRNYFEGIPASYEEAARIDGASEIPAAVAGLHPAVEAGPRDHRPVCPS